MCNYEGFLPEIHRVLRPGGMFLFSELDYTPYESHNPNQTPITTAPHAMALAFALHTALEKQSISVHAPTQMVGWLLKLGGFFFHR